MKLTFLTFYVFSFFIALGQTEPITLPEKDGKINFEEIILVDTVTKEQLYDRAKLWVINTFKNEKIVTSTADKELGELKGTGLFTILKDQDVLFTFRISVKDFKYKYNISDVIYLDNKGNKTNIDLQYYYDYYKSGKKLGRGMMTKYLKESKTKIEELISSLKKGMTTTVNDW